MDVWTVNVHVSEFDATVYSCEDTVMVVYGMHACLCACKHVCMHICIYGSTICMH